MTAQQQTQSKIDLISEDSRQEIDHWIAKYPQGQRQSAVMSALRIVQDQNGGWLSDELIEAVAEYLQMPAIAAQEVATFYSMYELKPVGCHKICVCTNISCLLCGSNGIVDHLKKKLGIDFGEVTNDGKFSLKEVECLGACVGAPMFQIGEHYYENLTPQKVDEILAGLE
ncbi:MAG TPA: NADH-quinone oxidoreductase subunit NuoE [Acidiferrobacteraceae bacterium]|nr:NADH-quinone oxidoreductase subunit NuoE [Acidiferrobacteraceae bacterium]HEX20546.1 NADH-quinone oxidoreductase subunit NuoE [Acidiferrobacteraceae bacterium]